MTVTISVAHGLDVDLSGLGVADDDHLLRLVGLITGLDVPEEVTVRVDEVVYDLSALTTRGRYRVHGTACRGTDRRAFSCFVKVVQSWGHTPEFQFVPEAFRTLALAQLPWRVEPLVYASGLGDALPPGLRMPDAYAVLDLADDAAALWLEDVQHRTEPAWTLDEHVRAARALGRFACGAAVRDRLADVEPEIAGLDLRTYVSGRVALRVVPMLRTDELWAHPGVAAHFGELRGATLALADRLPELLDELDDLPQGMCHGDACTRNLLRSPGGTGDDLTLIDFGFVRHAPLGCDLGQLVLGEIQLGERDPAELRTLWAACSQAYLEGLRDEGSEADPAQVLRAAAICMTIFSGISAVPIEELHLWPTPNGPRFFAARADVARFLLDAVGAGAR